MRKLINKKIVDTNKMSCIAERKSHYSHSNNPIGWESIYEQACTYYLHTCGGNDIYAPEDDIEIIGDIDVLLDYIEDTPWAKHSDLLDHIEAQVR